MGITPFWLRLESFRFGLASRARTGGRLEQVGETDRILARPQPPGSSNPLGLTIEKSRDPRDQNRALDVGALGEPLFDWRPCPYRQATPAKRYRHGSYD